MNKKVARRKLGKGGITDAQIMSWYRQWSETKGISKAYADREKELNANLKQTIVDLGVEDEKGHMWLDLPSPTDTVKRLKREKRVTTTMDPEKAEALLVEKGLDEECMVWVRVVNEDAVYSALYQGQLTEADLDSITESKESFALKEDK
jgi:hypothetical protein